ncbi:MAG: DegV family protein [Spirochaetota bacterium]
MKIAYLDGDRLRRALIVGAERLMERAPQLNAINVFPVPDGDTGTNMASTARTMIAPLRGLGSMPLGTALRTAADSALSGARGNSGAILAQFIQGLSEELGEEFRITTKRFAQAARGASRRTRAALSRPREGTILTILHDWALAAERCAEASDDFIEVLRGAFEEAKSSLARTTDLLPELRKAGVVDAGAQGFFHVLEGIMAFIGTGRLRELRRGGGVEKIYAGDTAGLGALDYGEVAGYYRYCTECFVEGSGLDLAALRSAIEALGDSFVLAGSNRRAKIHIHTNRPQAVFRTAGSFGELSGQKVDDMELQRRMASRGDFPCAVLVDSAGGLPEEDRLRLLVERVSVQVHLGGKSHLDGDGLRAEEFFGILRASPELDLSTSQPSPADFSRKFDLLLGLSQSIVYIGIAECLSGTFEAGRRAGEERSAAAGRPGSVRNVDSLSISIGASLVCRRAAEKAATGASAEEVVRVAEAAAKAGRLLVAVPDLRGLIKSGRLGGVKGLVLRAFGLRPLITLDDSGKPVAGGIYLGAKNGVAALLASLRRASSPKGPILEVIVGHVDSSGEAEELARAIASEWRLSRPVEISPVCPALAAHTGLGALALAFAPAAS